MQFSIILLKTIFCHMMNKPNLRVMMPNCLTADLITDKRKKYSHVGSQK